MDKKVLLIADDDEMNRKVIRRFMSNSYEVIEAVNGREAVETIQNQNVDALLLDIIMPELDGLEVLRLVRADRQYDNIGILVATSTKEKTERAALSLGADDIVSKPYDPIVITRRLENILLMKEVRKQKNLLQNHEDDAVFLREMDKFESVVSDPVEKLHRIAEIIRKNKDNTKLLAEMADSIDSQAAKIIASIADSKARRN